jgi:aryl-alcohol dehydrogenase-like predicted oxidoreductase
MTGNGRELGGSFALGPWRVRRAGYGAMQLAGDGVFGPPRDRDEALRVLRAAVAAGVDHIDTAQYYGVGTVNDLIREALYPYPDGLAIVSKVAARRDSGGALARRGAAPAARRPRAGRPGLAHHLSVGRDGQRTMMIASIRYLDEFVKQDDQWLFAERRLMVNWTETRPSTA